MRNGIQLGNPTESRGQFLDVLTVETLTSLDEVQVAFRSLAVLHRYLLAVSASCLFKHE